MRITEANTFLHSFKNNPAKELVCKMMEYHYSEAITEHHPASERLNKKDIQKKCKDFVHEVIRKIEAIENQPEELFPLLYKLSRKNPDQDNIWFEEFDEAYENYKHHKKLLNRLNQLKPFLTGSSYCDIGCGGGDLVAFLKKNHPQFREYAGIDVLDWRTDSIKEEINFQMLDFSKPGIKSAEKYDLLTCLAVLHHVGSTEKEISTFLKNISTAINDDGRLIVEEDVILPDHQINSNRYFSRQVDMLANEQKLFPEFLKLSEEAQRDVIIIIDFLANSLSGGIPEMAFPCGFRTIDGWINIFSKNYFIVEDVKILGFVNGVFNRSGHVFFILKPKITK